MKIIIRILIGGILLYALINVIIKIANPDILKYNGRAPIRLEAKDLDSSSSTIFESKYNNRKIFVYQLYIVNRYKFIFIEPLELSEQYTVDYHTYESVIKSKGGFEVYIHGKPIKFNEDNFITFQSVPDSIKFNDILYTSSLKCDEKNLTSRYRITLGPFIEWLEQLIKK